MADISKQAFCEVYDIIQHMEAKLYNKIPKEFVTLIEQNKDNDFIPSIDYSKSINEQELLQETRSILSLIYREYLCSEDERNTLKEKDREELKILEEKAREMYNPDNIFKNKQKTEVKNNNNLLMKLKKENIWIRFIKILNNIIRKK